MAETQIVLLDNFDSFTYNLVDQFRALGYPVTIYRNDLAAEHIYEAMQAIEGNVVLVLSPGPGNPSQAGCLLELIGLCADAFPIIGICLGHQALIQYFGGEVGSAGDIIHGKSSHITHCADRMFSGLANPLPVARYHSLMGTKLSDQLDVVAHYDAIPMAVIHQHAPIVGFQFHPESILTTDGATLLTQTLTWATQQIKEHNHA